MKEKTYDEKLMAKKIYCAKCGKKITLKKAQGFINNEKDFCYALSFCSSECQQGFFRVSLRSK